MAEIVKGRFYGVGVGPGDPSLLTLRGAEILRCCPVIAAPRTSGGNMAALEIVRSVIDLEEKEVIPLDFFMSRDPEERERAHRLAVRPILDALDQGRSVAMINLGDVTLYSTAGWLLPRIRQAGYRTELIPGVTSYSAASAILGRTLADGDAPLHVIPALGAGWKKELDLPGTKVLMKPGDRLPAVYDYLEQTDRLSHAVLVLNCGMDGEKVIDPFLRLPEERSYYTLVIVKE